MGEVSFATDWLTPELGAGMDVGARRRFLVGKNDMTGNFGGMLVPSPCPYPEIQRRRSECRVSGVRRRDRLAPLPGASSTSLHRDSRRNDSRGNPCIGAIGMPAELKSRIRDVACTSAVACATTDADRPRQSDRRSAARLSARGAWCPALGQAAAVPARCRTARPCRWNGDPGRRGSVAVIPRAP